MTNLGDKFFITGLGICYFGLNYGILSFTYHAFMSAIQHTRYSEINIFFAIIPLSIFFLFNALVAKVVDEVML